MQNEFILVRTDGTYSVVEILDEEFFSQARKLLCGNLIQRFYLFNSEYMFFKPNATPGVEKINFYATHLNQVLHKGNSILGDTLIGRCYGEEVTGLTSDSINKYIGLLEKNGYENKCT